MALIDEAMEAIKGGVGAKEPQVPEPTQKAEPKPKAKSQKKMSKAEIEAYRQKKMALEEARYLKMQKKENKPKPKAKPKAKPTKPAQAPKQKCAAKPKMLQPLKPLYLLRIPGLPKGDCIAICYAQGAE